MTQLAQRGHIYLFFGQQGMAMESGERVLVRLCDADQAWLGASMTAHADWLHPLPMKYFAGQIPPDIMTT